MNGSRTSVSRYRKIFLVSNGQMVLEKMSLNLSLPVDSLISTENENIRMEI